MKSELNKRYSSNWINERNCSTKIVSRDLALSYFMCALFFNVHLLKMYLSSLHPISVQFDHRFLT